MELTIYRQKTRPVEKKEINKTYTAGSNDQLKVDNSFGNITISHWNKNEVAIQVLIETEARNEQQAQQELERIDIQTHKSGNTISAITKFRNSKSNKNTKITVDYFITLPAGLTLDLKQSFGNINLPQKNQGITTLDVQYGNIKAGSFTKKVKIKAQYSNIELQDVNQLNMDVSYCGDVSVGNGEKVSLKASYSNATFQKVTEIDVDKMYGKLQIKQAENVSMDVKYSDTTIDYLTNQLNAKDVSYGPIHIKELSPDFKDVKIKAHYTTANIAIPARASFTVNAINLKYGSFSMKGFNTNQESFDEEKTYYKYVVNGGKGGIIFFDGNSYGHIHIQTH